MNKFLVIVLLVSLSPLSYGKVLSCDISLNSNSSRNNTATPTASFISYLAMLLDLQILTQEEFEHFTKNLADKNILIHPFDVNSTSTRMDRKIHYDNLQAYLDPSVNLDKNKIFTWAKNFIESHTQIQAERTKTNTETTSADIQMRFKPVDFSKLKKPRGFSLSHKIEVMETLVTAQMWKDLMRQSTTEQQFSFKHQQWQQVQRIFESPNHPIENITWWSAVVFANKLSKKMRLKPAYDLSKFNFDVNTRAEHGDFGSQDSSGRGFNINAPNENIYLAEGFRLPTNAEYEYMFQAAGIPRAELARYAWYDENSEDTTHPVAELNPLMIGDSAIYDLIGNVSEWMHDKFDAESIRGKNPIGAQYDTRRGIRGGDYTTRELGIYSPKHDTNSNNSVNVRTHLVGFRLVRTIRDK